MSRTRTQKESVAWLVADYWREAMLAEGDAPIPTRLVAHPLALIQAALDGETDARLLGVEPDSPVADMIRAVCRGA